jgi:hypothetical protein
MSFPIDGSSGVRNISPGRRWNSTSPTRKGSIQFPIKLSGLVVVLHRKALDLTDMKEVPGTIRLRDLGTFRQRPPPPQSRPRAEADGSSVRASGSAPR